MKGAAVKKPSPGAARSTASTASVASLRVTKMMQDQLRRDGCSASATSCNNNNEMRKKGPQDAECIGAASVASLRVMKRMQDPGSAARLPNQSDRLFAGHEFSL